MLRTLHIAAAVAAALALAAAGAHAAPKGKDKEKDKGYVFAAIGHTGSNDKQLVEAIGEAEEARVEFIVATGVKSEKEPCSDKLYTERRKLLNDAKRPVIVSLAASDWTGCRNSAGRTNAIERLNRLRELYFFDADSLGKKKLELKRLSASEKFRSYAENAHWEVDGVLYATVNVPSDNNHFLRAAGRNSEYEDRLVANRSWLRRLFALARQRELNALVLFTEADISAPPGEKPAADDGFAELRKQLDAQSKRYKGKLLLVDSAPLDKDARPEIEWRGNIGHLSLGASSALLRVTPGADTRFSLAEPEPHPKARKKP
ncbi:hypothetical protein [Pseudoduganella sp. GCM10020061]|uniref:hypothetical protein n=1 Tax=Pseudoduganella sp. GCM10020061 TaxID=3317345 RepID=UPI0036401265